MNPTPESAGLRRLHRPPPGRRDDPALQARALGGSADKISLIIVISLIILIILIIVSIIVCSRVLFSVSLVFCHFCISSHCIRLCYIILLYIVYTAVTPL